MPTTLLLEVVTLCAQATQAEAFERAFYAVQAGLQRVPGYAAHELQRCLDEPGQYLLLIEWQAACERTAYTHTPWWRALQGFQAEAPVTRCYRLVAGLGIHTPPPTAPDFID